METAQCNLRFGASSRHRPATARDHGLAWACEPPVAVSRRSRSGLRTGSTLQAELGDESLEDEKMDGESQCPLVASHCRFSQHGGEEMRRLMEWRVSAFSAWLLSNANAGVWTSQNRISSCRPCHASARPRSTEAELRERREDYVEETQPGRRWRQSEGRIDRRLSRCKACFSSQRDGGSEQQQQRHHSLRIGFVGNSWSCSEANRIKAAPTSQGKMCDTDSLAVCLTSIDS